MDVDTDDDIMMNIQRILCVPGCLVPLHIAELARKTENIATEFNPPIFIIFFVAGDLTVVQETDYSFIIFIFQYPNSQLMFISVNWIN